MCINIKANKAGKPKIVKVLIVIILIGIIIFKGAVIILYPYKRKPLITIFLIILNIFFTIYITYFNIWTRIYFMKYFDDFQVQVLKRVDQCIPNQTRLALHGQFL